MNPVYYIGYILTVIPYMYFLNHFLVPRYSKIKTTIICGSMIALEILFTLKDMYYTAFKIPVNFLFLLCCCLIFYRGRFWKKFITPMLIMAGAVFVELPWDFVINWFLNMKAEELLQDYFYFILQIIVNIQIYLFYQMIIRFLNNELAFVKQYSLLVIAVCMHFFLATFVIGQIMFMQFIRTSIMARLQFVIIMFVIVMAADLLILWAWKRNKKNIKLALTIQNLESEYRKQLECYLMNNDDSITYLRHDIVNYLLHQKHR